MNNIIKVIGQLPMWLKMSAKMFEKLLTKLKNEMIVVVGSEKYVVGDTDFFNEAKSYK
jgi:hypothetical protein